MRNFLRGPRVLALLAVTGLFLLFQNMTPNELGFKTAVQPIEVAREREMQGLLSMYYADGLKHTGEHSKFLNFLILEQIEKSLSPTLQARALEITQTLISDSREWDFDPLFVLALVQTESQYDTAKKGQHGERGLLQILPATAERIAEKYHFKLYARGTGSLEDPKMNLQIGIRYLDSIRAESSSSRIDLQKHHAVSVMKNYIALSQQMAKAQKTLDASEALSAGRQQ